MKTKQLRLPEKTLETLNTINEDRKQNIDSEESWSKTVRIIIEKGIKAYKNENS